MLDIEFCKQLLKLEDDWHVAGIELDEPSHRLDITIRFGTPPKKSLFKRVKTPEAQGSITLRHLPLGGYRTYLHVPRPGSVATTKSWGAYNSSFTHEMEALIVQALNSCRSSQFAADLLDISADEVREVSERIVAGADHYVREMLQPEAAPTSMPTEMEQHATAERSYVIADTGNIPAETDQVWDRIIEGELRINTAEVGLQMILQRVRLAVERNPGETSKLAGIRILRQFLVKHQARLQNEVIQLSGRPIEDIQVDRAPEMVAGVPAEDHPNWSRLIDGEIRINTSAVGLQMVIERVRLSVERNPTEASRRAGIKILRQFFLKHQSRLQSEIRMLSGQSTPAVSSIQSTALQPSPVPPESHPSWQRLINGEFEIRTDVVALKLMLERIRISISNNPTDAARLAGARILRQYFLKYQNKHRAEIDQILAA